MSKKKIKEYIYKLAEPREEFGNMPTCPYAHVHLDEGKMEIKEWDPKKSTIIDELKRFSKSKYRSTAWYVKDTSSLFKTGSPEETEAWTEEINEKVLNDYELGIIMVTFNPNDKSSVDGFAPRSMSPYFTVGAVYLEDLNEAHDKLEETTYFDKLTGDYKDQLV